MGFVPAQNRCYALLSRLRSRKELGGYLAHTDIEVSALETDNLLDMVVRVSHGVNKKLLLAIVDEDFDITYYNVEWTRP